MTDQDPAVPERPVDTRPSSRRAFLGGGIGALAGIVASVLMDSRGSLFICTANGTPGTWRKVTTKLV